MRTEKDVFNDLSKLCVSPGYAHVIAYIFFEDNVISYSKTLTAQDIQHQYSCMERLTHTELSTLIGLMYKNKIDITLPAKDTLHDMYKKTKVLLKEMQYSSIEQDNLSPIKEAIFYGGESAYDFQYFELAVKKYQRDNQWLFSQKGFSIEDAKTVFLGIKKIQDNKLQGFIKNKEKKESIYSN